MANTKLSELTALTTPADADKLIIVDDSEASVEQTKYITHANYQTGILTHATEIPFTIGATVQVNIADGKIEPETANDIDLGSSTKEFKNLYLEGTVTIDDIAQGKDVTAALHRKIINIGDWNMDSTTNVSVTHGLTLSKIRCVSVLIRNDGDTTYYPVPGNYMFSAALDVQSYYATSTSINLQRLATGYFDSTSFDSTNYNRGWVVIDLPCGYQRTRGAGGGIAHHAGATGGTAADHGGHRGAPAAGV